MKLVEGVKDIVEYPLNLGIKPSDVRPGELTRLTFGVVDPKSGQPVRNFEVVHEKLFHLFVVSQDLKFFLQGSMLLFRLSRARAIRILAA